jgi:hypothetical protein
MKKLKLLLPILFCGVFNFVNAQFEPNISNNYFSEKEIWSHYFDSIQAYRYSIGDSSMKGTGLKEFRNWKAYWDGIIPSNGNFAEGEIQYLEMLNFQKKQHHTYNLQAQSASSSIPPVSWTEIGPTHLSKVLTKNGGGWVQAHATGTNNITSAMHVAKVDRLYQHPTIDNIIYAIGGESDNSGGGLFISYDSGTNWQVMGTDFIPKLNISSFTIKPIGESPSPNKEFLFIGSTSGGTYRSENNGVTWLECNYYGNSSYPYVWGSSTATPHSLPNVNLYFSYYDGKDIKNGEAAFTRKSAISTSDYSRLILCRQDGLYYSDNYDASISISPGSINNSIMWDSFDLSSIHGQIQDYNSSVVNKRYNYMEFEHYEAFGGITYLVYLQVMELDAQGNQLGYVRNYIIKSINYGASWSFLGGNSTTLPQGNQIYHKGFISGHIEVKKTNPNFIYIATPKIIGSSGTPILDSWGNIDVSQSMHLFQHAITSGAWNDLSASDNGFNGNSMIAQGNGFALDPTNDNNWWFYTNTCRKMQSSNLQTNVCNGYSTTFHADLRDILVLRNGKLLIGTDGGVYRSTLNDATFVNSSEGLGMSHASSMALSQKPPYYVASGFWHCGLQIYNPDEDKWHQGAFGDGQDGEIFFLNNEVYNLADQNSNYRVIKGYNQLSNVTQRIQTASSENITGRAYGARTFVNSSNVPLYAKLVYSNNDFTSHTIFPNSLQYEPHKVRTMVIPNEPDKLMGSSKNSFFTEN